MAYIYRHIRKDINMPFYIGVGDSDSQKRRAYDNYNGRRSKEWLNVANVTEYEIDILMENIPLELAYKKETEFIQLYGRTDLGTGTLVNKTDGGKGPINGITKETREKMAARLRGRLLPKWHCEILSNAAMGKKVPWRYTPIVEVNKNGEVIKEFDSITIAAKEYSLEHSNIIKVIKGQRSHTGGRIFKYKNHDTTNKR